MQLDRRSFLTHLGVVGTAATLLPAWLRAGSASAASGPLILGYELYGMKRLSLPAALDACAQIGYGCVEFCFAPGYPTDPAHFAPADRKAAGRQLKSLGLRVTSALDDFRLFGKTSSQTTLLESIKAAAGALHDVASGENIPLQSVLGGKESDWEKEKERAAERLRELADAADREGVSLVIKAHAGMAIDNPEKLLWMLEAVGNPRIGINYDQSHFELAGVKAEDGLRQLAPHIRLVTVKDAKGTLAHPEYLLAGDGDIDYPSYFKQLRHFGYQGPVAVEVSAQLFSRPGYDPLKAARHCYEALAPALREANA